MDAIIRPRVAFQGERGAFGELAITQHWRGRAEPLPSREFADVARAVEGGAAEFGVLAGYPMVDLKVTLTDGAYHEVDSSELAFKIAGSMAFKKAAAQADPVLLEPVMAVEVRTPDDYMGDVIGDLNSRRGQIQAMEERSGLRVVKALVPLSEMFGYVGDLRSRSQGRADYSMQFDSYAEVPPNIAEQIIEHRSGEPVPA